MPNNYNINREDFIRDLRTRFSAASYLSDEDLYLWGVRKYPNKKVESWPDLVDYKKGKEYDAPVDTSPSKFQSLLTYGVDENSSWVMRTAYANSLSGIAVDWYNGSSKFTDEELADYDPAMWEEAASGVMSFLMPLDLLTLFTGGFGAASAVGGKVVAGGFKRGVLTSQIDNLAKKGSVAAARRGLSKMTNKEVMNATLTRVAKEGVTLAEYEGIKANLNAQLKGENVFTETLHGIVHGGLMGATFGLTGGYLGAQNARLLNALNRAEKTGNVALVNKLKNAMKYTGKGSQFATEVATLQGIGTLGQVPDIIKGDASLTWDKFGRDLIVNSMFAGTMNLKRRAIKETSEHLYSAAKKQYLKDLDKRRKEIFGDMGERIEEQKSIIRDSDVPSESKEAIIKSIESQQKEINEVLKADPKASIYELLAGQLKVFHDMAEKNPELVVDNFPDFIKTVRASQEALSKLKQIDPTLRTKEKNRFDELTKDMDEILKSAESKKEENLNNHERYVKQVETVAKKLKISLTEKNEKGETVKKPLHILEGEVAGHEKHIDLQNKQKNRGMSEIMKDVLREGFQEAGLGKFTIDKIHEIHKTQAHVDRLVSNKEDFLKRTDLSIAQKSIKDAILQTRREGGTALDEIAVYKAVFGEGKAGTGARELTVRQYRKTVGKFFKWLGDNKKSWTKLSEDDIATFYREAMGKELGDLNPSQVAPLKNLYNWANKRDNLDLRHEPHLFLEAVERAYNRKTTTADYKLPTFKNYKAGTDNVLIKLFEGKDKFHQQGFIQWLIQSRTGMRVEELYSKAEREGLAFEDIQKINNRWNIVLPEGKTKTNIARNIPISAEEYKVIKKFKESNNLKDSESLLSIAPQNKVNQLVNKLLTDQFGEQTKVIGGKKKTFRFKSDHARDMLQQIGTFGTELTAKEIRLLNYALGHGGDYAKIEKIYLREISPEQLMTDVRRVFDKIQKTEFQTARKGKGVEGFFGEYQSQVKFLKEKFPSLYEHFTEKENLGKMGGELILGRIVNRAIEIATDYARPDTLPHEIHHHVVNVLKAIGDPKSKKLIEDGVKMFRTKEGLVEALGKYSRNQLKGGAQAKVRKFVNRFWGRIREYFGFENKSEVIEQLHKQFTKGEAGLPEGYESLKLAETPEYQLNIKKPRREIQGSLKALQRRRGLAKRQLGDKKYINQLKKDVMAALGYEKEAVKHFDSTLQLSLPEAKVYYDYILNRPKAAGKGGYFTYQESAMGKATDKYGIPIADQRAILRAIGVKDGVWENASKDDAKIFMSFARKNYSELPPQDNIMSLTDTINRGGGKIPFAIMRAFTPTYVVLKRAGEKLERTSPSISKAFKNISQAFIDYDVLTEHYIGEAKKLDNALIGKLGKHKDLIVYHDKIHPRDKLTEKQLKVLESKDFADAEKIWGSIRELMWEGVKHEMRLKLSSAKYEEFAKDMNDKYIMDYMTRSVNPELVSALWNGMHGSKVPMVEKMYNKVLKAKAGEEASKKYKKNGTKWKQVVEELTDKNNKNSHAFQDKAWEDLRTSFTYSPSTMKVGFLKTRGTSFDEKVEIINSKGKKKIVDAYDKTHDGTVERYMMGMTKLIASLRYFPEWTELGRQYGLKNLGADWAKIDVMERGGEASNYINKAIRRELGLDFNPSETSRKWQSAFGQVANLGAATGLTSFFFTQAQKNVILGTIRTYGTFGGVNTLKSIASVLDPEIWDRGFKYGETGTKSLALESRKLPIISHMFKNITMEKVLKTSGMIQTEKLNRIVAANAGQFWFDAALRANKGEKNMLTGMMYKDFKRMQDEVWQFSDAEQSFIRNNSLQQIFSNKNVGALQSIRNKVAHYSHKTTQGGTTVGMLPLWMSNQWVKPWSLFTRIATSVTHDTYRNYMKPVYTSRNPMPLLRAFVGAQLGGKYLWGMYDWAFGLQNPTEQSDNVWHEIMANAWRAEFLGIFGEILSPYMSPLYSQNEKYRILEHIGLHSDAFSQLFLARQTWETGKMIQGVMSRPSGAYNWIQTGEFDTQWNYSLSNWANRTSVAIGQATKFMKKRGIALSPSSGITFDQVKGSAYEDAQRLQSIKGFFEREKKYDPTSFEGHSRRQPYYRELRDVFWLGDEEQRAKAFWKTYAYLVTDLERGKYTSAGAHKEALSIIKGLITRINPLSMDVDYKGREASKKEEFYNYLDSDWKKKAKGLEKKFFYNKRQFWKDVEKTKWRDRYSVYFDLFD